MILMNAVSKYPKNLVVAYADTDSIFVRKGPYVTYAKIPDGRAPLSKSRAAPYKLLVPRDRRRSPRLVPSVNVSESPARIMSRVKRLMMNSLYGKFGARPGSSATASASPMEENGPQSSRPADSDTSKSEAAIGGSAGEDQ